MVAHAHTLSDAEREFLLAFPDDTNRSPWMVETDLHSLAAAVFREALRRYRADWYVSGNIAVLYSRPDGRLGQVAPDALVAFAPNLPRDAFDSRVEPGGFPPFVLEVVSTESRGRDTGRAKKVQLYDTLGVQEYAIFDPRARRTPPLSGYWRGPGGQWVDWLVDASGALHSEVLGLDLRAEGALLRPYTRAGLRLPTEGEAREEAERARETAARAREAAEARAAAAEAEVAALRALLARRDQQP